MKWIICHYISDKMSSCGQCGNYSDHTEEIFKKWRLHVIYFGWETLGTLNKLRIFPLIQCVWLNDGAVLTFKEQQTRGNVLLHLCITILTWKTLLPIRSVCVCVCKSPVLKSSSTEPLKILVSHHNHQEYQCFKWRTIISKL